MSRSPRSPREKKENLNNIAYNAQLSDDAQLEVLDDEPKSILFSLIKQLTVGMDLSRVTLPAFILEPRSMLEKITDFIAHPQFLLE